MKKSLFTAILIAFFIPVWGQMANDIIITATEQIPCIIKEVGSTEVKFNRIDRSADILYTLPKSKIKALVFKDGTIEEVTKNPEIVQEKNEAETSVKESMQKLTKSGSKYYYGRDILTKKEVENLMYKQDYDSYKIWKKKESLYNTGMILTTSASGLSLASYLLISDPNLKVNLAIVGLGCAAAGLGILIASYPMEKRAIESFNRRGSSAIYLDLKTSGNGLTLALRF